MGACLSFCLGEEKSLNAKIYVEDTVEVISGKYKQQTGIVYSYGKDTMKIQFGTNNWVGDTYRNKIDKIVFDYIF